MKKRFYVYPLLLILLIIGCEEPSSEHKKNTTAQDAAAEITQFYFDGFFYQVPAGSSVESEMRKRKITITRTFYTPLNKSTVYFFNDDGKFNTFVEEHYPDFDMAVVDHVKAGGVTPAAGQADSQVGRVQACGEWGDFRMQWYSGSLLTTTGCNLFQSYVMNFVGEFGFIPNEIYFRTPSTGTLSASVHYGENLNDCPLGGGSCYVPTYVYQGPGTSQTIYNLVYSNTGGIASGHSMQWLLSRVASQDLYVIAGGEMKKVNRTNAAASTFLTNMSQVNVIASTSNYLYIVDNATLYRVNPYNDTKVTVGTGGWSGTEAMAAAGGYVYAVQSGLLWKVNVSTGAISQLGTGGWSGTEAMAAAGGYVYAVQSGLLWKINANTGSFSELGTGGWSGTEAMTVVGSYVYAVQDGLLWKVNTSSGSISPFGTGGWAGTTAMTNYGGYLYAVQNGVLYSVNTSGASIAEIGNVPGTVAMTSVAP